MILEALIYYIPICCDQMWKAVCVCLSNCRRLLCHKEQFTSWQNEYIIYNQVREWDLHLYYSFCNIQHHITAFWANSWNSLPYKRNLKFACKLQFYKNDIAIVFQRFLPNPVVGLVFATKHTLLKCFTAPHSLACAFFPEIVWAISCTNDFALWLHPDERHFVMDFIYIVSFQCFKSDLWESQWETGLWWFF